MRKSKGIAAHCFRNSVRERVAGEERGLAGNGVVLIGDFCERGHPIV